MNIKEIKNIAIELLNTYSYYNSVHFDFIVEAVENTIADHNGNIPSIRAIHDHIVTNYI